MFSTAGVVFEQRSGAIEGKERLDFPPLNNAIQRWPDRSELNGPRFVHTQRVCRVVFCLSRMTASGRFLPVKAIQCTAQIQCKRLVKSNANGWSIAM